MRSKLLISIGVSIIAAALIIGLVVSSKKKKDINVESNHTKSLDAESSKFSKYLLDANKDTVIYYPTGSIIQIPANSLLDQNGKKIKGKYTFTYREFHNVGEIIFSDVSMKYDSAGITRYLESAGMFEMHAQQNNKPLKIDENKSIEVNMVSFDSDQTKFNQYYFDSVNQNWVFQKKDKIELIKLKELNNSNNEYYSQFNQTPKLLEPVKPKILDLTKERFKININLIDYPELSAFDKVIFEVAPENVNYNPNTAKVQWELVELEKIPNQLDRYKITFSNSTKSYSVIGVPVVTEENYHEAVVKYNSLFERYKSSIEAIKKKVLAKAAFLKKSLKQNMNLVDFFKAKRQIENAYLKRNFELEEMTYRPFNARNFGIYNSDCPNSLPQGIKLFTTYKKQSGEEIEPYRVMLIDKTKNLIFRFWEPNYFSFDPEDDNILLVIGNDNSISWCKPQDDISTLKGKNHQFVMKTMLKEHYTPEDINEIVALN